MSTNPGQAIRPSASIFCAECFCSAERPATNLPSVTKRSPGASRWAAGSMTRARVIQRELMGRGKSQVSNSKDQGTRSKIQGPEPRRGRLGGLHSYGWFLGLKIGCFIPGTCCAKLIPWYLELGARPLELGTCYLIRAGIVHALVATASGVPPEQR